MGSLNASSKIHHIIIDNLMHATMTFFESQPIGRIMNRISTDLDQVDGDLINAIDGLVNASGRIAASILTIIVAAPWNLTIIFPAIGFALNLQSLYRRSVFGRTPTSFSVR